MIPENACPMLEELMRLPQHEPFRNNLEKVRVRSLGIKSRTDPLTFRQAYLYVGRAAPGRTGLAAQSSLIQHLAAIAWFHGLRESIQRLKPKERRRINAHLDESQGALPNDEDWINHTHKRRQLAERALLEAAATTNQESTAITKLVRKVLDQAQQMERELTGNENAVPEERPGRITRKSSDKAYWQLLSILDHEKATIRYGRVGPDLKKFLEQHNGPLKNHLDVRNALLTYRKGINAVYDRISDVVDATTKQNQIDRLIQHWDGLEWLRLLNGLVEKLPQREAAFVREHLQDKAPDPESLFTNVPWQRIQTAERRITKDADKAKYPTTRSTMGGSKKKAIITAGELLEEVREHLAMARVKGEPFL